MFSTQSHGAWKIVVFQLLLNSVFVNTSGGDILKFMDEDSETKHVSSCILKIVRKYVPCNKFISVVISGGDYSNDVITTINGNICYSVALKSYDKSDWLIWTETYIVLSETILDFSKILSQLANDAYWNPRADFIVLTSEIDNNIIRDIFQILLRYNIFNVVVLTVNENDVQIHTYFPFGNGACGRRFEDTITLGECENVVDTIDLFSNQLAADHMKNCTVKLIVHEDIPGIITETSNYTVFGEYVPGMEQYLLNNIAVRENFTFKYKYLSHEAKYGVVFPNRTVTGMFAYLQAGLADMAVGGLMLMKNRADVFDYIWGYNYERLSLFTPVLDSKSWKNIFKSLGPRSWTLTAVCFFVVCAVAITIVTLYPEIAEERLLLIFKLWGFFFQGNSDKHLLKVKRMRLLLFFWIWLTFFITNFYSTAMYSMVTTQIGHKTYFDIDDLTHLPFKPCISENIRTLFFFAYNERLPMSDPTPACRYTKNSLTEVGYRKDMYSIGIKQSYKLREYEFINFRGQNTIDVWDFSNALPTVVYIKKGDPLKGIMEKYAKHMYEAGLMQKHFSILCLRSHSAIMRKSNTFVEVRLEYLKNHFFVLGVGIIISTIIFVLELLADFIQNRIILV